MKSLIAQCVFCGSLAIGLWTTLLIAYFQYDQENEQLKKTQDLTRANSLRKNVYQQNHVSKKTPKQNASDGKSDAEEPGKPELYPGTN